MTTASENKVALVTGGAGGIGSAICQKFAAAGYSVVVTYHRNAEKAQAFVSGLAGANHFAVHAPVDDAAALSKLAALVAERCGKLDVLVNNAGVTTPVPHDDLDGLTDEWIDRILSTNVHGTFAMIRACKNLLLAAGPNTKHDTNTALVVNISSVAAITGIGSNVMYCASKAAINSMTRSLARALAPAIRVVSVSPGWVLGEYAKSIDPAYLKMQEDLTPLGRLATPEDVANTVFALATHLTFTTGSIIPVDGGRPLK
ncbi:MAG: SDR family oxidoreductase [Saprospiraceae bacterium]|nr:SDR family oxidoreductase [Saprospiraceae bacterium]